MEGIATSIAAKLTLRFVYARMKQTDYGAVVPKFKDQFVALLFWSKGGKITKINPYNANTAQEPRAQPTKAHPM